MVVGFLWISVFILTVVIQIIVWRRRREIFHSLSLKKAAIALARLCTGLLMAVSLPLVFFSLMFRIDDTEDLALARRWDLILGLPFAAFVVLFGAGTKSKRASLGLGAMAWVLVSGCLLLWHEFQVQVRWRVSDRTRTVNLLTMTRAALADYARDCGGLPPEEKGLAALVNNPGVAGWAGPYVQAEDFTDPWGNELQYRVRDGRAEIWSKGPDGVSGTADDIQPPGVETGSGQR